MQSGDFLAYAPITKEIINSANLLKSLKINVLIRGDIGTGKKTLAKTISQSSLIIDAKELQSEISDNAFSTDFDTVIIDHIENITNIDMILNWMANCGLRIIATTKQNELSPKLEDFFAIKIFIPPLDERKEDIKPLANKFAQEAAHVLGDGKTKPQKLIINTVQNGYSLRQSVFFSYLFESINEGEIMMLLEKLIYERLEGENNYRDFLYLFETPLLRAAQKKYKSQLQMAKHLGLNRVTLRKKLELNDV
ncbi:sigma 54-interacting transcriptional regulator [Arcobacter sp. FWKO B]|uniref:sigma 54-interacting transcriptional regulator n=1 Tax=Arcobacter sp. FWKO B TaxID=2593672 RepID=UPI0018A51D94|nr:sigma 54-interacting transcriptional regulator [Arcobacter sp. FWKO B]QOG12399.1 Fis family transcriptional regulator [Arcobacter sp. FWKO B]